MLSISPSLLVCINTVGSLHPKLLSAKTIKGASTEESILASKCRNLHLQICICRSSDFAQLASSLLLAGRPVVLE